MKKLEELRKTVTTCQKCVLSQTRNNVVFGGQNPNARVMFAGEAPGKNEDLTGEPFVGAAGKRLQALLDRAHLSREEIFIGNIVKCRPPKNRNPKPSELHACSPYLVEQIKLIKPEIVVTLGTFASQFILQTKAPITSLRGRIFEAATSHTSRSTTKNAAAPECNKTSATQAYAVLPVFHPAAAIYDPSKQAFLEKDFELLRTWLDKRERQ